MSSSIIECSLEAAPSAFDYPMQRSLPFGAAFGYFTSIYMWPTISSGVLNMTTVYIRYDSAALGVVEDDYKKYIRLLLKEIRSSLNISDVNALDLSVSGEFDFASCGEFKPGHYLYVPIISKCMLTKVAFLTEFNIVMRHRDDHPSLRMIYPIGAEHIDTSILYASQEHSDVIANILSMYGKMTILEEALLRRGLAVDYLVDSAAARIHNDAQLLRELRAERSDSARSKESFNSDFGSGESASFSSHKYEMRSGAATEQVPNHLGAAVDVMPGNDNVHFSHATTNIFVNIQDGVITGNDENSLAPSDDLGYIRITRPKRIVVSKDGSGNFRNLFEAIRKANEGDTIIVKPGRYEAPAYINKSITITGENKIYGVGADKAEIIINKGSSIRCSSFVSDAKKSTSYIKLKNLYIRGDCESSAVRGNAACIYAEDCDLHILECIIVGGSHGLHSGRDVSLRTTGGAFTNSYISNIYIENSSSAVLERTHISDSKGHGVLIYGCKPIITHCRISRNNGSGIKVSGESGIRMRECKIEYNLRSGIELYISDGVDVTNNEIVHNGDFGLVFHFSCQGQIIDNSIEKNKQGAKNIMGDRIFGNFRSRNLMWLRNKE